MSVQDLIGFLDSPQEEVTKVALENVLPDTPSAKGKAYLFKNNDFLGVRSLKKLSIGSTDEYIVMSSLIALINLSDDSEIRAELASDPKAIKRYATLAASSPKTQLTKYACMLLSNLSREMETVNTLKGPLLMALVLSTAKPSNVNDEDLDYLGFAFAEVARRDPHSIAKLLPNLYLQLAAGSVKRRQGVAATIKNTLFEADLHDPLAQDTPLIETIMVCLMGPEKFDDEDFLKLPPTVQRESNSSKRREAVSDIIELELECLLLLSSTQVGRDSLRSKNTYFIVRELHKATNEPRIAELCEKYVNMVMRGDPKVDPQAKIEEVEDPEEDGVMEVV